MPLLFGINGTIYIVLDEENVERIQQFDPCDITPDWTSQIGPIRVPLSIVVAYAKKEEYERIQKMPTAEIPSYLRRGYQIRPSDHERGILLDKLKNES